MERRRTTKCGPITSEMTWQEILVEFRKLDENSAEAGSLSQSEGLLVSCALFTENDQKIISGFPVGLTDREFKERLYFGRYGEHLPEDFFERSSGNV